MNICLYLKNAFPVINTLNLANSEARFKEVIKNTQLPPETKCTHIRAKWAGCALTEMRRLTITNLC